MLACHRGEKKTPKGMSQWRTPKGRLGVTVEPQWFRREVVRF